MQKADKTSGKKVEGEGGLRKKYEAMRPYQLRAEMKKAKIDADGLLKTQMVDKLVAAAEGTAGATDAADAAGPPNPTVAVTPSRVEHVAAQSSAGSGSGPNAVSSKKPSSGFDVAAAASVVVGTQKVLSKEEKRKAKVKKAEAAAARRSAAAKAAADAGTASDNITSMSGAAEVSKYLASTDVDELCVHMPPLLPAHCALLAAAVSRLGHQRSRHRGTQTHAALWPLRRLSSCTCVCAALCWGHLSACESQCTPPCHAFDD